MANSSWRLARSRCRRVRRQTPCLRRRGPRWAGRMPSHPNSSRYARLRPSALVHSALVRAASLPAHPASFHSFHSSGVAGGGAAWRGTGGDRIEWRCARLDRYQWQARAVAGWCTTRWRPGAPRCQAATGEECWRSRGSARSPVANAPVPRSCDLGATISGAAISEPAPRSCDCAPGAM